MFFIIFSLFRKLVTMPFFVTESDPKYSKGKERYYSALLITCLSHLSAQIPIELVILLHFLRVVEH